MCAFPSKGESTYLLTQRVLRLTALVEYFGEFVVIQYKASDMRDIRSLNQGRCNGSKRRSRLRVDDTLLTVLKMEGKIMRQKCK